MRVIRTASSSYTIPWPAPDGGYIVGEIVLAAGQVGQTVETYWVAGVGEVTSTAASA